MALGWLWWRAWVPVDAVDAAAFCVAGVALGDINLALCVAGVARGDMDVHFCVACVATRGMRGTYKHWAGSVGAPGSQLTSWRPGLFAMAGVALGDMDLHFAWQAWHLVTMDRHFAWQVWHLWHWAGSGGALGSQLTPSTPRLFAWQA